MARANPRYGSRDAPFPERQAFRCLRKDRPEVHAPPRAHVPTPNGVDRPEPGIGNHDGGSFRHIWGRRQNLPEPLAAWSWPCSGCDRNPRTCALATTFPATLLGSLLPPDVAKGERESGKVVLSV